MQYQIYACFMAGKVSPAVKDEGPRCMAYLWAMIKEELRKMPPASGAMFKQVQSGGNIIDSKYFPGGPQIDTYPLGIQPFKSIYGPDANHFRPERWIEANPEKAAEMARTVDLVIHRGKW